MQPDGKIVVAGYSLNGSNDDFALVRYNADGSLDTTFGGAGKVITPVGSSHDHACRASRFSPTARSWWRAIAHGGVNYDFALVRYNADGSLDTTFGGGTGKVVDADRVVRRYRVQRPASARRQDRGGGP